MFNLGDKVRLSDTHNLTGWAGLTGTVIIPGDESRDTMISLDAGLTRPDRLDPSRFSWPTDALTLIDPDTGGVDPALTNLRDANQSLRQRLDAARQELIDFKTLVAETGSRYAVEHDWCAVYEKFCDEVGLERPMVTKRFSISGSFEVEIPRASRATLPESISSIIMTLDSDFDGMQIHLDDLDVEEA